METKHTLEGNTTRLGIRHDLPGNKIPLELNELMNIFANKHKLAIYGNQSQYVLI